MTTKVLINVPRLDTPGGVVNFYLVLRRHLDPDKHYFEIGAKVGENGVIASFARALADYWRFHRKLSAGDYSIVHLNPSMVPKSLVRDGLFLLIARAHSVPVIAFFHGWDSTFLNCIKRRYRAIFRFVFGKAVGIIVLAQEFRQQLDSVGLRTPIFRMTTLVDDAVFEEPVHRTSATSPLNILYLSRLDHGKGLVEAVTSFALLKRAVPDAALSVAGDGPEKAAAEALINRQHIQDVNFLGYVQGDAKRQAFRGADIYFFPTFWAEGMPTTVLEAMAYGLPVVTRSVGGLKDFFENENMGFMTASSDPEQFAKLLQRIVQDPNLHQRMSEYNRRYARDHFAASTVAHNLEDIYARTIGAPKRVGKLY